MPVAPPATAWTRTSVVASHSNVPSDSGLVVGIRYALTFSRSTCTTISELAHFVPEQGERDAGAMRLSLHHRLGQVRRLFRLHARRHRRLESIDHHLGERRSVGSKQLAEHTPHVLR